MVGLRSDTNLFWLKRLTCRTSGAGGRSSVSRRKRDTSTLTSASSNRSRSSASALAVMACDSTLTLPWNTRWTILLPGLVREPPRPRWRLLRNHDKKSTGSDCAVRVKRLLDRSETSCSSSWGETWALNARGFQILRKSVAVRLTSSLWLCDRSSSRKKLRSGGTCASACTTTLR
ncbi:hypothetical protein PoMZ_01939 [Pyricularia oryzae]|uniref:Uncharacterized protein n=1 Tax=Pyricularia oryzae TaxID=318829 RepID=A0A4P7NA35_PYROR|nr:hypothetical protein PoMZ_01939 [Pyricularia oryzae]